MIFSSKRTCDDLLKEIRHRIEVIAQFPTQPPSAKAEKELLLAGKALAKRALKLLKKVDKLDIKAYRALEGKFYLISKSEKYNMLRPQALSTIPFLVDLEKACEIKLTRKATPVLKRGKTATYGRIMTNKEFRLLKVTGHLQSADPGELIPAFQAPANVVKSFMKKTKKEIKHLYSWIGGTGNAEYVVFFRTNVVPVDVGRQRGFSMLSEVKFPHGTPVQIVDGRSV